MGWSTCTRFNKHIRTSPCVLRLVALNGQFQGIPHGSRQMNSSAMPTSAHAKPHALEYDGRSLL